MMVKMMGSQDSTMTSPGKQEGSWGCSDEESTRMWQLGCFLFWFAKALRQGKESSNECHVCKLG